MCTRRTVCYDEATGDVQGQETYTSRICGKPGVTGTGRTKKTDSRSDFTKKIRTICLTLLRFPKSKTLTSGTRNRTFGLLRKDTPI